MFEIESLKKLNISKVFKISLIESKLIFLVSMIVFLGMIPSKSTLAQSEESELEVAETTDVWLDTVTSGDEEVVGETVALYAEDGILWGTVSEQVRDTPAEIQDYFEYFANLPDLSVSSYQGCVRTYDENFAINSGYYNFTFSKDGETKEVPARYSFTYQKNDDNQWEIIEHHSSALPEAPDALEIVNEEQDACENGLLVEK